MKTFNEWLSIRENYDSVPVPDNPNLGEGILDYFNTGRKGKVAREKLIRDTFKTNDYSVGPRFNPWKRRGQKKSTQYQYGKRLLRQKIDKNKEEVWNSMPKDLQDKLNSNLKFVGTYDDGVEGPWKADGLKKAISDAYMVGDCQGEGCTMWLRYKDADTEVQVYNWSNGWGTAPTQISVVHKGQQFNWNE
jgi:hypothetical protein